MLIRGQVMGPVFLLGILAIPVCGVAQSVIAVGPGVVQFTEEAIGNASSPQFALVTNVSAQPFAIDATINGGNTSDFALTSACPSTPQQLAAYSNCSIGVTFTPSAPGVRTSSLTVTPQSGAAKIILLVGQGQAVAKSIGFGIANLAFPALPIGVSAGGPGSGTGGDAPLMNTGNAPVTIRSISLTGANLQDFVADRSKCPNTLGVGGTCIVAVTFQPMALGYRTAGLVVSSDAAGPLLLPLTGVGTPAFTQLSVPALINFPKAATGNTQSMPLILQNSGSETVTISNIGISGPNAPDFFISQNPCATLAPQSNCRPTLTFTPSATGLRAAAVIVSDTAPGSPHIIPVEGIGEAQIPQIKWELGVGGRVVTDFGGWKLNTEVIEGNDLQNDGDVAADLLVQLEGPNTSGFQMDASNCTSRTIVPGGSCGVSITFMPTAAGESLAYIAVTDTVSGQVIYWPVIGSGIPLDAPFSQTSGVDFSPQIIGTSSASAPFGIPNPTQAPLTITGFTLSGGTPGEFSIPQNGCIAGTVIPPQGSCPANIVFTPAALGFRTTTAVVSLQGVSSALQFPITGTGVPSLATISISPTSLLAVGVPLGAQASQFGGIGNTGNVPVTVSEISVAGLAAADYSVTGCAAPIVFHPKHGCQFNVDFLPSAVGLRPAFLQITDDATGSPQNVPLLGVGTNGSPVLGFGSQSLNFSGESLGSSHQLSLELYTGGAAAVTLANVRITGPNTSDFSLANGCPAQIPLMPGCQILVTFTPSVTGLRVANLEITSNAAGSPQLIPLSGVGFLAENDAAFHIYPSMLTFPSYQGIGYATTEGVSVTATGNLPIALTGIKVSGPAASDFSIVTNNCPLSPAPLIGQCLVNVSFSPSSAGVRAASLYVADTGSEPIQSIPLIGLGAPAFKRLAVTPGAITFDPVSVGSSTGAASQLVVGNSGTLPLTWQSTKLAGPDAADFGLSFRHCAAPATIPLAGACSATLEFFPSAPGVRTATLTITTDAPNGTQTITLSGTGL